MSPTIVAAYLLLFFAVGALFLFVNLLLGRFLRPKNPNAEKLSVYECGEPTIGTSFVQFDLRFYVVALLFIIFDVEVAFFFPWAAAYGKAVQLTDPNFAVVSTVEAGSTPGTDSNVRLTPAAAAVYREFGIVKPDVPSPNMDRATNEAQVRSSARFLAAASIGDIAVFFAVLMVGFAYVWSRGDLNWVRAVETPRAETPKLRTVGTDDGSESVLAG